MLRGPDSDVILLKSFKDLSSCVRVDDFTDISALQGFTLESYIVTKEKIRIAERTQLCKLCTGLLTVAKRIADDGYIRLNEAFSISNPGVKYKSTHAKRKLLQMALAAIRIKEKNNHAVFLVPRESNLELARSLLSRLDSEFDIFGKEHVKKSVTPIKDVLAAAESDAERERITYAVAAASGQSNTKLRSIYGFEDIQRRKERVENALREARKIREAVDSIASIQEKAVLSSFGIQVDSDDSDDDEESETDTENEEEDNNRESQEDDPVNGTTGDSVVIDITHQFSLSKQITDTGSVYQNSQELMDLLRACELNWFLFVEVIEQKLSGYTKAAIDQILLDFSGQIQLLKLNEREESIIEQSRQAYLLSERLQGNQSDVDDDAIGSETEESGADWGNIHDPLQPEARAIISQKVKQLKINARRKAAQRIAEARFLRRKRGKNVGKILKECPDIGSTIENYVKSAGVGAESWRRTGILTFDGNRKVEKKATFSRIKEHLERVYQRRFGYGTVVQLCVARNKRRLSASRYKGLAKVTCRRARKGFTIRYNPDKHWSSALYRALDALQLKDGTDIININRDDQAGFRLDTLATHNKQATLCIQDSVPLTTKTDYVNKYPSTLQTTSYNFSSTGTTAEICAGIVKAIPLHQKNPAQHAHDLNVIETYSEVEPAFFNHITGERKSKVCVRVDGGHDEGPSHKEVQFWWTNYHLEKSSKVLIVTTRDSGSSNRNRVELQNGCLALGHSNLFIPSTLNGSCFDSKTGKIDDNKLKENLNDAIDIYISRVNKSPCANTNIHLYKGTDSSCYQTLRAFVKVFLKGNPAEKANLKNEHPGTYNWIDEVWSLRNRHLVSGMPSKYVFHLFLCYQPSCIHPLCKLGAPPKEETWYDGGPPLSFTPLPVADLNR